MASVLFTAFALIAAGQAELPSAPAERGKVESARSAPAPAPEPGPRAKSRNRR